MNLLPALQEYAEAKIAFSNCPDMLKSTSDIPLESQAISRRFFTARENLALLASRTQGDEDLANKARQWAAAHGEAQVCPGLALKGKTDQAAKLMGKLGRAEAEMLEMLVK